MGIYEDLPDELQDNDEAVIRALETVLRELPDPMTCGAFPDGLSRYYSAFEAMEDEFCDIVGDISSEHLQESSELVSAICNLALKVDAAYTDDGKNPYERFHVRLPGRISEILDQKDVGEYPLPEEATDQTTTGSIDESRFTGMTPEERLLHLSADRYDWYAGKWMARFGTESRQNYLAPGGEYVSSCMIRFTKLLIADRPGLFGDYERWRSSEQEIDLELVYEEISRRLSPKLKVERKAFEYYYSEYVGVTVNETIFFRLVRGFPMRIIELWVNKMNSEYEHAVWIAPDRLDVFCEMTEYLAENYARFSDLAEKRAAKMRERYGLV